MADITEHLRPEERELYLDACYCIENQLDKMPKAEMAKIVLERLAECRRLMEKHRGSLFCHECGGRLFIGDLNPKDGSGCKPGCLWAQAIGNEVSQ